MRNGYWSGGFFSWEIEVLQCVGFIKMEFSPSNHKINNNHVVFSFYIFPLVPSLWWNRGASFPNFSSLFHGIFVRNITINLKCWQHFIKKHKCWKLEALIWLIDYISIDYDDTPSEDSTFGSPLISDLLKRSSSFQWTNKSQSSFKSFKNKIKEATSDIRSVAW